VVREARPSSFKTQADRQTRHGAKTFLGHREPAAFAPLIADVNSR
jgi:hypothetical protein